jgi:hypothetical protein
MNDEEISLKIKFKKVDELVSLRTSVIYVLIVLIGGTIGLLLSIDNVLKTILFLIGIYYVFIVISNLNTINTKIDKILYKEEDK